MSVFSAEDYRGFILEKIKENSAVRGYQARLSEAAQVHGSYISRVINGHVHLTPDQAADLSKFWRLDPEETDYFTDLVLLERSTSLAWRARIQKRLDSLRHNRERLERRFSGARSPEEEGFEVYYSAWFFSAVHMLLTIPGYQRVPDLGRKLHLPEKQVESVLETLARLGLATAKGSQWRVISNDLHLPERKIWARTQHGNWRQHAAMKIQGVDPEALHYSGVHTMSRADGYRLKQLLIRFLEESRKLIEPSPEEEIYFLGCDFYGF